MSRPDADAAAGELPEDALLLPLSAAGSRLGSGCRVPQDGQAREVSGWTVWQEAHAF